MLSSELEFCLNEAFQRARDRRHEFMTVEHLLLALLDIPRVHEILKACNSNIPELRRQLTEFIDEQTPLLASDDDNDVQPTLGFQRVLQRAVFHVQSSGKKEVTSKDLKVAVLGLRREGRKKHLELRKLASRFASTIESSPSSIVVRSFTAPPSIRMPSAPGGMASSGPLTSNCVSLPPERAARIGVPTGTR